MAFLLHLNPQTGRQLFTGTQRKPVDLKEGTVRIFLQFFQKIIPVDILQTGDLTCIQSTGRKPCIGINRVEGK